MCEIIPIIGWSGHLEAQLLDVRRCGVRGRRAWREQLLWRTIDLLAAVLVFKYPRAASAIALLASILFPSTSSFHDPLGRLAGRMVGANNATRVVCLEWILGLRNSLHRAGGGYVHLSSFAVSPTAKALKPGTEPSNRLVESPRDSPRFLGHSMWAFVELPRRRAWLLPAVGHFTVTSSISRYRK